MSRRAVAGFGYRSKQRRGVFPNHVVRVRREVPCVVRDVERIASDLEREARLPRAERVAGIRRAAVWRRQQLKLVAALDDQVPGREIALEESFRGAGRWLRQLREARRV